jgi:hypothetical protein
VRTRSKREGFAVAAALLFSACTGKASINACPALGRTISSFGSQSTSNGCYENDKTFTNFALTGSSGFGNNPILPTAATIDFSTETTFLSVTTPWTVTAFFSGVQETGASRASATTSLVYLTNSHDTAANDPGAPSPTAGYSFYIDSITLGVSGSTGSSVGGDTISVAQMFCAGNTTCTTTNSIMITAMYGNNSSTPSFNCSAGATETFGACAGAHSATANLVSYQTLLNTSTTYTVTAYSETNVPPGQNIPTMSTLNYFSDTFGEIETTPEPSTFGLFGSALVALYIYGARRGPRGAANFGGKPAFQPALVGLPLPSAERPAIIA